MSNITDGTQHGVLSIAQAIVPWLALTIAAGSAWLSLLTYRINKRQARERMSNLVLSLDNVWYTKNSDGRRDYALSVLIINNSSSSNSIVTVELVITVALKTGHEIRIRVPGKSAPEAPKLPVRLDSFESIAARLLFSLESGMLPEGRAIRSHVFEFVDASGSAQNVVPKLLSEKSEADVSKAANDSPEKHL